MDTYFKGTTICALVNNLCEPSISGSVFTSISFLVNPFSKSDLYLNEDEFVLTLSIAHAVVIFYLFLLHCHKDPEVSE